MDHWNRAKSNSPKLEFYHKLKNEFGPGSEKYLTLVNDPEARKSLTRLRISAHNLFIERGRYENPLIPREDRICLHCSLKFGARHIESEHHVLLDCPLYFPLKNKFGFNPCNEADLMGSLSNQDMSAKDATAIAKTVHAILTSNAAYCDYYKNPHTHLCYGECKIL